MTLQSQLEEYAQNWDGTSNWRSDAPAVLCRNRVLGLLRNLQAFQISLFWRDHAARGRSVWSLNMGLLKIAFGSLRFSKNNETQMIQLF